jgi:hypothetical protein
MRVARVTDLGVLSIVGPPSMAWAVRTRPDARGSSDNAQRYQPAEGTKGCLQFTDLPSRWGALKVFRRRGHRG